MATKINSNFKVSVDNVTTEEFNQLEPEEGALVNHSGVLKKANGTIWETVSALNNMTHGWGYYSDSETSPALQVIGATPQVLSIDAANGGTETSYLPPEIRGVSQLWDSVTNCITPINIGDGYTIRIEVQVISKTVNPTILKMQLDIGDEAAPTNVIVDRVNSTVKSPPYTFAIGIPIFSLATFKANGARIFLSTDIGTVSIGKRAIGIHRLSNGLI